MRRILFSGLLLLLPNVAHAQAQGPEPAKPTEPATPSPAPAEPAPAAPASPPSEAPPSETAEPGPALATSSTAAGAELTAAGPTAAATSDGAATAEAPKDAPPPQVARRGQESEDEGAWKFDYHGYLRAPMRLGINKRLAEDTNGFGVAGRSPTTFHEAVIPDDQYLSFQSTAHNMRTWAEGFFSFGNNWATGVLGFGSYNLTEASFSYTEAQWGISQAYVLLTPDLGYENVRIWAKAGAIVDRYGMSGRYDAGEYDMYMFGRTHVMGETFHVDYDITPAWTLYLEQGFGTKEPDPNPYNNAHYTLLHHEHVGLKQGKDLEFGAHYLMSWSQEEFRNTGDANSVSTGAKAAPRNGLPNGKLWVTGVEARAELGAFGYIYGAYSHVGSDYALNVSRAIEVLHASGGGEFELGVAANYLDSPNCLSTPPSVVQPVPAGAPQNWQPLDMNGCSDGNGSINALHAHYEFSLTNFQQQFSGGQRFWGRGFDAILKLYGLLAFVNSESRDTTKVSRKSGMLADAPQGYKVTKSKFGADVTVQVFPWLSPGVRFDRVVPNSHIPEQSFAILSPRLQFKSQWVTHERITLGYSHYFYDQRVCDPLQLPAAGGGTMPNPDPLSQYRCTQPPPSPVPFDGFGTNTTDQDGERATSVKRPDENVVKIEATMWW